MEEVKTKQRNLAETFYDYKKVYDKVHHDDKVTHGWYYQRMC